MGAGGFLKLIKMKTIYLSIILISGIFTGGFIALSAYTHSQYKNRLKNKIALYQDSLNMARAQLALHNANYAFKYADDIKINITDDLNTRMRMRARIWHYQWKIDSLNMRLKNY